MRDALDDQIEAYEALLPTIKKTYGSVWALVAGRKLIETFAEFPAAARYAIEHHGGEQVLIRHTDEQAETAPYVHIEG